MLVFFCFILVRKEICNKALKQVVEEGFLRVTGPYLCYIQVPKEICNKVPTQIVEGIPQRDCSLSLLCSGSKGDL